MIAEEVKVDDKVSSTVVINFNPLTQDEIDDYNRKERDYNNSINNIRYNTYNIIYGNRDLFGRDD